MTDKEFKEIQVSYNKEMIPKATGKEFLVKEVLKKGLVYPKRYTEVVEVTKEKEIIDGNIDDDDEEIEKETTTKEFTRLVPLSQDEVRSNSKKFKALIRAFESPEELYATLRAVPIYEHELDNTYIGLLKSLKKALSYGLSFEKTLNYNVYGDFGYLMTILQNHFKPEEIVRKSTLYTVKGFQAKALQSERKRKEFKALRDAMKPSSKEFEHGIKYLTSWTNWFLKINSFSLKEGLVPTMFVKSKVVNQYDTQKEKIPLRELVQRYYKIIAPYGYKNHGAEDQLDGYSQGRRQIAERERKKKRLQRMSSIVKVIEEVNGKKVSVESTAEIENGKLLHELNLMAKDQLIETPLDMKIFKEILKQKQFSELRLEPKDDSDKLIRHKLLKDFIKVFRKSQKTYKG